MPPWPSARGETKENVVRASCFYRYEDGGIGRLRHNELNVRSGDFVMRADHGRPVASGAEALSPAEKEDSRDLQREIIGEALNRLEQSAPG